MKRELSILIPTFNDVCNDVVKELQRQASQIEGLSYEIVVADDGSTDTEAMAANEAIADTSSERRMWVELPSVTFWLR